MNKIVIHSAKKFNIQPFLIPEIKNFSNEKNLFFIYSIFFYFNVFLEKSYDIKENELYAYGLSEIYLLYDAILIL